MAAGSEVWACKPAAEGVAVHQMFAWVGRRWPIVCWLPVEAVEAAATSRVRRR